MNEEKISNTTVAVIFVLIALGVGFIFGRSWTEHSLYRSLPTTAAVTSTLEHYREVADICGVGNIEITEKPFTCIDWGLALEVVESTRSAVPR